MKKDQYIVSESDINKRVLFYEEVMNHFKLKVLLPKEKMVNSKFPFVVDLIKKEFWVCDSITCCAAAASVGKIITTSDFKKLLK